MKSAGVDWRYLRRRSVNIFNLTGAVLATAFGLFWLLWILWTTLSYGISAIDWSLFQQDTPAPGGQGGLANAIMGSVIMVGLATAIGTPTGILAGTYLAEYGGRTWVAGTIRFINDILLSAPSIIIGLFVYELVVLRMGHFSALAGAIALAIIMLPVVIRTTEEMLRLVPNTLREAALALGVVTEEEFDRWVVPRQMTLGREVPSGRTEADRCLRGPVARHAPFNGPLRAELDDS